MKPLIMRWKELPANPNGANQHNTKTYNTKTTQDPTWINIHIIENSIPLSKSPPWRMNPWMIRWKELPANPNGANYHKENV